MTATARRRQQTINRIVLEFFRDFLADWMALRAEQDEAEDEAAKPKTRQRKAR